MHTLFVSMQGLHVCLKLARERLAINGKQVNLSREEKIWLAVACEGIFFSFAPPSLPQSRGISSLNRGGTETSLARLDFLNVVLARGQSIWEALM